MKSLAMAPYDKLVYGVIVVLSRTDSDSACE